MTTRFTLGLSTVCLVVVAAVLIPTRHDPGAVAAGGDCPRGFSVVETAQYARLFRPTLSDAQVAELEAQYGRALCLNNKRPEPISEILAVNDTLTRGMGQTLPGAYRAAVEAKSAMSALQPRVAGATGTWHEYGRGPLLDDPERGGLGLGIPTAMGRVDSFAYDPDNNRLFALIGTGGVWMSEADTVAELGDLWVPIG
ncbi:MAG: hypothetical protein ABF296_07330, partial [Oceanococcaceae bacterium]